MKELSLLVEDVHQNWNPRRFSIVHKPAVVAEISSSDLLQAKEEVLDMPIKLPTQAFRLPFDNDIKQIVEVCTDFEQGINPQWEQYHCYLTINQGIVRPGATQRNPGPHFDGMQGTRYPQKFPVCHQYLVSSALPTTYYVQPFATLNLDPDKHNWFKAFEQQVDPKTKYQPKPFELLLQTAYCVHESTPASAKTSRTFVRVEFSLKEFNRIGNSINPLLETG